MTPVPREVLEDMKAIARHSPRFVEWLAAWREQERDALEVNGNDITRGRALALKELLHAFKGAVK